MIYRSALNKYLVSHQRSNEIILKPGEIMKYKILLLSMTFILIVACDRNAEKPKQSISVKEVVIGKELPAVASSYSKNIGGACAFDKPQTEGDYQFVSGWALISKDTLADGFYIGIEANGVERFTPILNVEKRDDVAKYFNNLSLLNSGFSAYIKKSDVPNGSKMTLYQTSQGGIYACNVKATF